MKIVELLHQPLGMVFGGLWSAHRPGSENGGGEPADPSEPPDDDPRPPRGKTPGRRSYDIDGWGRWWRQKWTRRAVAVVGPVAFTLLGGVAKEGYDRYRSLPPLTWVSGVDAHVAEEKVTRQTIERNYSELVYRVAALEQRVADNGERDARESAALKLELRELRVDLQRWFIAAGAASNGARR